MTRVQQTVLSGSCALTLACSAAVAVPGGDGDIEIDLEFVGFFNAPMAVTSAPDELDRLFVAERDGVIRIMRDGTTRPTPFIDISSDVDTTLEGGLLGIAIHPDFAVNGHVFMHYTRDGGSGLTGVIERVTVSGDPDVADPSTRQTILELPHPSFAHVGGWIEFGPMDGMLYIAFGDGDADGFAQDITDQWHGKILRVDVNADDFPEDPLRNYAIPVDNPFVGIEGDDEIFLTGLRNPFRFGIDRATGDLYIGDVGDSMIEEVDVHPIDAPGGANFGWGCMEGSQCLGNHCVCNDPELVLPVHEYTHADGCAVTGGTVYRGCAIPALDGVYLFSDFCQSSIRMFRMVDGLAEDVQVLPTDSGTWSITSFSTDARGEIYTTSLGGPVHRIVAATPPPDKNGNGIPDTCESDLVPGDLDGDGDVDVADLLALLAAWGPCDSCAEDLDASGAVDVADLLALLANWG